MIYIYIIYIYELPVGSEYPKPRKANTNYSTCVMVARQVTSGIRKPLISCSMGCYKDWNRIGWTKKSKPKTVLQTLLNHGKN